MIPTLTALSPLGAMPVGMTALEHSAFTLGSMPTMPIPAAVQAQDDRRNALFCHARISGNAAPFEWAVRMFSRGGRVCQVENGHRPETGGNRYDRRTDWDAVRDIVASRLNDAWREPRRIAEWAVCEIELAAEGGREMDADFIEEASGILHDQWVEKTLSVPYDQVAEAQKEPYRGILRLAISIRALWLQENRPGRSARELLAVLDGTPTSQDLLEAHEYEVDSLGETVDVQARAAEVIEWAAERSPGLITEAIITSVLDGTNHESASAFRSIAEHVPQSLTHQHIDAAFERLFELEVDHEAYVAALGFLAASRPKEVAYNVLEFAVILRNPKWWVEERVLLLLERLNETAPDILRGPMPPLLAWGGSTSSRYFLSWCALAHPEWFDGSDTKVFFPFLRELLALKATEADVLERWLQDLESRLEENPEQRLAYEVTSGRVRIPRERLDRLASSNHPAVRRMAERILSRR